MLGYDGGTGRLATVALPSSLVSERYDWVCEAKELIDSTLIMCDILYRKSEVQSVP